MQETRTALLIGEIWKNVSSWRNAALTIDVVPAATPPVHTTSDVHASWWAYVILVVGEVLILWLLQILLHKLCGLPNWVMIILVAVTAVLDIFFIQTWAAGITELLSPYLGWLPFS